MLQIIDCAMDKPGRVSDCRGGQHSPSAPQCQKSAAPARVILALTLALVAGAGLTAAVAVVPAPAYAHGFGERYDLPLPLSLFIVAGVAAVLLSFAVAAVFLRDDVARRPGYPRLNLLRTPPGRWLASAWVAGFLRALSVILTAYVILGALVGSERAALNPAPAAVYVAFWVGLSFFTALFGNLWALVNPWAAVWRLVESLAPGGRLRPRRPYPRRWGQWPAALAFLGFAILETVAADAAGPRALGWILVGYTAYNFAGMYLFGRQVVVAQCRSFHGSVRVYGALLHNRSESCRRRRRVRAGTTPAIGMRPLFRPGSVFRRQSRRRRRRRRKRLRGLLRMLCRRAGGAEGVQPAPALRGAEPDGGDYLSRRRPGHPAAGHGVL